MMYKHPITSYIEGYALSKKHVPIAGSLFSIGGKTYEVLTVKSSRMYSTPKKRSRKTFKKKFLGWKVDLTAKDAA